MPIRQLQQTPARSHPSTQSAHYRYTGLNPSPDWDLAPDRARAPHPNPLPYGERGLD
ncbi:hypothetical protein PXNS11_290228 [Stutzerimonas xanthomarina]|nr:hypothetical protein PXNS11_290228 [Stutzerimonas xanthomarina]